MNQNLREVVLPGGGRALVRLRLTHEQDTEREAAILDYWDALPDEVLAAIADRDAASTTDVVTAARRTPGYGAVVRATDRMKAAVVRACTVSWEGVSDPDGNALAWPAGIPSLSTDDLDALYEGCLAAAGEVRADPNAGAAPSAPPSSPADPTPGGPLDSEKPGG